MSQPPLGPLSEKYYDVSPYVYCNDNPVNLVDPDGREGVKRVDENGHKEIVANIVLILQPQIEIPANVSVKRQERIEKKNEQIRRDNDERIQSAKEILDRVYNGEQGGSYDSSGDLVHFEFNIIGIEHRDEDMNASIARTLAYNNGLPGEKMGVEVIARAPVVYFGPTNGAYGMYSGNSITLSYGAPEITLPHEVGHSFNLRDMSNAGGVMDDLYPGYYLMPFQVDLIWLNALNQR